MEREPSTTRPSLIISNRQDRIPVPGHWPSLLADLTARVLAAESLPAAAEVSLTFVDDAAIRELNRTYRGKDAPTDVLSFPQWEPAEIEARRGTAGDAGVLQGPADLLLGDVVISLERAAAQAEEYGHSLDREVAYLYVHGLLHLLGYDHPDPEAERAMHAKAEAALAACGLTRP